MTYKVVTVDQDSDELLSRRLNELTEEFSTQGTFQRYPAEIIGIVPFGSELQVILRRA